MLRSAQTLQEQAQAVFLVGTPKYGAIDEHPSKPNFDLSKNYKNIKRLKKKHKGEAEKPLHKTEHKEQLNTTNEAVQKQGCICNTSPRQVGEAQDTGRRTKQQVTTSPASAHALHVVLHAHDCVAMLDKGLSAQRLREEISMIVLRVDLVHLDGPLLI
jgi:hypothetical protein